MINETQFKFFDSHSHLNLSIFDADIIDIVKRMEEKNIGTVCVGVDRWSSKQSLNITKQNKNVFACVGQHPVDSLEDFDYNFYRDITREKKVVAIGECGLDYFRNTTENEKERQKELFVKHIELAIEVDKPLILHIRPTKNSMDAYEDALYILESYKKEHREKLKGCSHCFVGNLDIAKRFIEIDFMLSFNGIVTFARDYDEIIKYVPVDMLLTETDSPFLTPIPHRGKTNEPNYIEYIIKKIAEIRGGNAEKLASETVKNAINLFNL